MSTTAKSISRTIIFTAECDLSKRTIVLTNRSGVQHLDQIGSDWFAADLAFTEGYTDFNVETAKRIIKTNFTEYSNINPIFAITENGEQINIPKN